jgi:hypothetical protein
MDVGTNYIMQSKIRIRNSGGNRVCSRPFQVLNSL